MLIRLLFSHYKRHPLQALFLLTGVILANTLLVGVQVINAQARASYAQSERELGIQPIGYLLPASTAQSIPQTDYIRLRRQGFDTLVPIVKQWLYMQDGNRLPAMGIDPIAASGLASGFSGTGSGGSVSNWFMPPGETWVASARARQLGWSAGQRPTTIDSKPLPPIVISDQAGLGHRVVMDIGHLQQLVNKPNQLSEIAVLPMAEAKLSELQQALPDNIRYQAMQPPIQAAQMTDSFHLNLTAMGLLSLVVGGFLIYNAISFSFTDRHQLFVKMRLAGVTRRALALAILAELALFTISGLLLGYLLGFALAAQLLPGLGKTLTELYGVFISYPDSLLGNLSLLPVAMTLTVVILTAWGPLREVLRAPLLPQQQSHWQMEAIQHRDRLLLKVGILCLLVCGVMSQLQLDLVAAFACMAALLFGVAMITPWFLRVLLNGLARLNPRDSALAQWLLADSRWLLGPAAVAVMAMVLVLVANSGLNTLIFSFRSATIDWLDQRLAAPLYLRPQQQQAEISDWLQQHYPQLSISERYGIRKSSEFGRVEIVSQPRSEQGQNVLQLIEQLPDARQRLAAGNAIWVSERSILKTGLRLGQTLSLCEQAAPLPIVGIYHDYGNPLDQWMIDQSLFEHCFSNVKPQGWALNSQQPINWPELQSELQQNFGLNESQVVNQRQIHRVVLAIFDQTFAVAKALNGLTLVVAAIGIFCATSAIHHHRLKQQALLAVLGINRAARLRLLFMQWGIIGLLMLMLVWPFGQSLAWILTQIVTPAAFGWRFPVLLYLQHYPALVATTFMALLIATLWPAVRLARARLADQLKAEQ